MSKEAGNSPGDLDAGLPTALAQAATAMAMATEKAGDRIGRYKLLEQLGEGGCGVVYSAEQETPVRRRVALKVIKLGMDTKSVIARFEAERQALAMMDHPNIAKVLDAGTTELGRPYFVMELVRGVPITEYCIQHHLGTKERLDLFVKVCQAIQHAHQKGIIHRDIKPSNILVTIHEGLPAPKVIDFGIAKAIEGRLTDATIYTQLNQFIGTPAYMSPEQAEMSGLDIDTRSDIYSLGVLLYELLTGRTPFDGEELLKSGLDEMRRIIREKEPQRPSTKLSQILVAAEVTRRTSGNTEASASSTRRLQEQLHQLKGDLDWIVMKCLEKDRTRRYETANGLAADLGRHMSNEPVTARPASTGYRLRKAVRRNRLAFAAGAAVVTALVAGIVGISLGLARTKREWVRAEAAALAAQQARREAEEARNQAEAKTAEGETNLYFRAVALAHRETTSEPANIKLAESLLLSCPERLRDWEWHYLMRRRYAEPVVLAGPERTPANSLAFSPDGRVLAAAGGDAKVRLWDLARRQVVQTLAGHTGAVMCAVFDPVHPDRLATAGVDRQLKLWDSKTGQELHSWPAQLTVDYGLAYAVSFSPDGKRLAAPAEKGEVIVHDIDSNRIAFKLGETGAEARCVTFSHDGRWIATGGGQGEVNVWEAGTGRLAHSLRGKQPPVARVEFTRDSRILTITHFNGTVRRWEVDAARELPPISTRISGAATVGMAVHPKADRFVAGGMDRVLTLADTRSGRAVLFFRELETACLSLVFNPDGSKLAAGSRNGSIYLWDGAPMTGAEDESVLTLSYVGEVWCLDVAPNGQSIVVGGHRGDYDAPASASAQIWSNPAFSIKRELPGFAIVMFSVAHHPSGRWLAASGDETTPQGTAKVKVWDLETGKEAMKVEAFDGEGRFFSVAYSPDGRWLAGAGNDKRIKIWSASTGRREGVLGGHAREITKIAFSPNGRRLASMGNDDVAKIWDARALDRPQTEERTFAGTCNGFVDLLAFSPDSERLAITADDDSFVIHDLEGPDRALRIRLRGHRPLALAFSPDGKWVASGGGDSSVRVWNAETGVLKTTCRAHLDQVARVKFFESAEGLRLVSGSRDGTVKLWRMGE